MFKKQAQPSGYPIWNTKINYQMSELKNIKIQQWGQIVDQNAFLHKEPAVSSTGANYF